MGTFVTPAPEVTRPEQDGRDRSLDELEHELSADPCHFLRRACQAADYGATSNIFEETRRAPR